ncbi:hypothetical protein AAFF_G00078010 [Aldrovandia affinis]|uniref:Uncharacterized protein n=1 Tax=Aldrovandia affinis TaxID=143900 RepID=A0AAD7WD08_9TELE|nr:hypothetical protein AAFF_G00078010 [Aldrovandia affinis]
MQDERTSTHFTVSLSGLGPAGSSLAAIIQTCSSVPSGLTVSDSPVPPAPDGPADLATVMASTPYCPVTQLLAPLHTEVGGSQDKRFWHKWNVVWF